MKLSRLFMLLVLGLASVAAQAQVRVYLQMPQAPQLSSENLAEAIAVLEGEFTQKLGPGTQFKPIRRADELSAELAPAGPEVVISHSLFLRAQGPDSGLEPRWRLLADSQRALPLVLVGSADAGPIEVADLAGSQTGPLLAELTSAISVDAVKVVPDEATVAANLVVGSSARAVILRDDELLKRAGAHIGVAIENVSMPIVAVTSLDESQLAILDSIVQAAVQPQGALARIGFDGSERIVDGPGPMDRAALLGTSKTFALELRAAVPSVLASTDVDRRLPPPERPSIEIRVPIPSVDLGDWPGESR